MPNLKAPSVIGSVVPTTSRVTPTDGPPSELDAIAASTPMIFAHALANPRIALVCANSSQGLFIRETHKENERHHHWL